MSCIEAALRFKPYIAKSLSRKAKTAVGKRPLYRALPATMRANTAFAAPQKPHPPTRATPSRTRRSTGSSRCESKQRYLVLFTDRSFRTVHFVSRQVYRAMKTITTEPQARNVTTALCAAWRADGPSTLTKQGLPGTVASLPPPKCLAERPYGASIPLAKPQNALHKFVPRMRHERGIFGRKPRFVEHAPGHGRCFRAGRIPGLQIERSIAHVQALSWREAEYFAAALHRLRIGLGTRRRPTPRSNPGTAPRRPPQARATQPHGVST